MRPDLSRQQKREKSWLKHNIRKLNKVDTTYIEPQRYNYAFMIQNTNTYELYRIQSNLGYSVTFAPNMSLRVGPILRRPCPSSSLPTGSRLCLTPTASSATWLPRSSIL